MPVSTPQARTNRPTAVASPYIEAFEALERAEEFARQAPWLRLLRKAGISRFAETGFPATTDEDWRYTNVAPITALPFSPAWRLDETSRSGTTRAALNGHPLSAVSPHRLVFVDGHLIPALSTLPSPSSGITALSLAEALSDNHPMVERHLALAEIGNANVFAALNDAYFADGAFVHAAANVQAAEPIHLLFLATGRQTGLGVHPRNVIVAEPGARVSVVESFASVGACACLTNTATKIVALQGAAVEHVKVQREGARSFHIGTLQAQLERDSRVLTHSFALGARLSRNNLNTRLAGEGSDCVLNGLYLGGGEQLHDHHMIVDHAGPRANSHEYFNGILTGRARGVFHGRILVRPPAQKTDAKQTNKNLLLSDHARIDSKPQLEIYADDVKCTHGATVGQLDPESVFYLRSRGIAERLARRMLVHAFAGEIIERIESAPVREELDRLVWDELEALLPTDLQATDHA